MKKFLCFIFALCIGISVLHFDDALWAKNRRRRVANTKTVYGTPTENDCNIDIDYCFNRYCFDKKTLSNGVYSKCGALSASTILINVEDCLKARQEIKQLNYNAGCKNYTYNRIVNLLSNKDTIETGLKRNSKDCQKATKALQAAKACYSIMISSDGSRSTDLYNILDANCGFEASGDSYMLNQFFEAGDYGASNLGAIRDLQMTGQNTMKRENWRQVVDATLAGYTEIAELACGAEDYKITKVNQYALDSHKNSAMLQLEVQSTEIAKQSANRIVNSMFRESDCKNSALPTGGLYWKYEKNGDPDCKIVCKEGYAIGKNSSTCVKIEEKKSTTPDLNIGTDWVGLYGEKKEAEIVIIEGKEPEKEEETPKIDTTPKPEKDICFDKVAEAKSDWTQTLPGLCDVFYKNGRLLFYERVDTNHSRNPGSTEYFCIGEKEKYQYERWYDMNLTQINTLLGKEFDCFDECTMEKDGHYYRNAAQVIACYCPNQTPANLTECKKEVKKENLPQKDTTPDPRNECENKKKTEGVAKWNYNQNTKTCTPNCENGYTKKSDNTGCKKEECTNKQLTTGVRYWYESSNKCLPRCNVNYINCLTDETKCCEINKDLLDCNNVNNTFCSSVGQYKNGSYTWKSIVSRAGSSGAQDTVIEDNARWYIKAITCKGDTLDNILKALLIAETQENTTGKKAQIDSSTENFYKKICEENACRDVPDIPPIPTSGYNINANYWTTWKNYLNKNLKKCTQQKEELEKTISNYETEANKGSEKAYDRPVKQAMEKLEMCLCTSCQKTPEIPEIPFSGYKYKTDTNYWSTWENFVKNNTICPTENNKLKQIMSNYKNNDEHVRPANVKTAMEELNKCICKK